MKKLTYQILAASVILFCLVSAKAATVTVTVADDGVSNIGANGTFYWAITNCQPGDTIAFAIPGTGPFFLQEPPNGFPLIYNKHGITIDGYSQSGALANTNPITGSNSASIMIVIDGRNNMYRSMDYSGFDGTLAKSDPPINNQPWTGGTPGFAAGEGALLGIYRSTNVTIKGLAFLGDNIYNYFVTGTAVQYGIGIACDYGLDATIHDALTYDLGSSRNCHIAGCWFGVNPTNKTSKADTTMILSWIHFEDHKGDDKWPPDVSGRPRIPNVGLTIGVGRGASNPRSEFNVFVAGAYDFEGLAIRTRISGNFIDFMPDGVTPYDFSTENGTTAYVFGLVGARIGINRYGELYTEQVPQDQQIVVGTDGDGVNDADEGNLLGPIGGMPKANRADASGPCWFADWRSGDQTYVIAGNRWGIGNDGTIWPNCADFIQSAYLNDDRDGKTKYFFGSDFASGRSPATIAAQANQFYMNLPIYTLYGNPVSTSAGTTIPSIITSENPKSVTDFGSSNACVSLRGNVMAGLGLAPYNYASNGVLPTLLLQRFTNCFSAWLCTNSGPIIPILNAGLSSGLNLAGTYCPGTNGFTNVVIDVYELDPYAWTNGQKFAFTELGTNGFPGGKRYIGSSPAMVNNSGSFNFSLPSGTLLGSGVLTVTANYSVAPAFSALGRTATSDFSMPITVRPVIKATRSGSTLNLTWDPVDGAYTVQTNASVVSPGTWGNYTVGNVLPVVSGVPIGTGNLFFRLVK